MRNQNLTTENQNKRERIFGIRIYPPTPAVWMLVILAFLGACQPRTEEDTSHRHDAVYTCPMHPQVVRHTPGTCPVCGMDLVKAGQQGNDREIVLTERQIALANIRVVPAGYDTLRQKTFLTGKLVASRELTRTVSSRAPGRIEKLFIKATGLRVEKGEPLYKIYSEQLLTLQREYLLALRQYQALGQQEKRYAGFMNAARKKLLLYGMNESQVSALSSSGAVSPSITFTAPVSGIVTEVMVAEGQYVTEGSPMYRLDHLSPLWVEAELYPRETGLTSMGDDVQVLVHGYENHPLAGRVVFLSPEYRSGTQVVTLRAEFPNPDGRYIPGMQATVVLADRTGQTLALPVDAVIREEKGAHIWVRSGEGTFVPRVVKTGKQTFDKVEILEGVQPGDSVVVSGAYLLYSELVLKKDSRPLAGHENRHKEIHGGQPAGHSDKAVDEGFRHQLAVIFARYLDLKDALVAADVEYAQSASAGVLEAAKDANGHLADEKARRSREAKLSGIRKTLLQINAAGDIQTQRAAFALLSESLYESLQLSGGITTPVFYQHCPMAFHDKGAYWLSGNEEIRNPYFGEQMLKCGAVYRKIAGK